MNRFIWIEDSEDLELISANLKKSLKQLKEEYQFLALNIKVQEFLSVQKIDCILIDSCIDEQSYFEFKQKSEEQIRNFIERLNYFSREEFDLEIGNYFFFQLYVVIGLLMYRSYLLELFFKRFPEASVVTVLPSEESLILGFRPAIRGGFSKLLQHKKTTKNVTFIPGRTIGNSKKTLKDYIRNVLYSTQKMPYHLWKTLGRGWWLSLCKKKEILMLGPEYNWSEVLELAHKRWGIFFLNGESFQRKSLKTKPQEFDKIWKEELYWIDYNLSELVHAQKEIVWSTMMRMGEDLKKNLKFIKKFRMITFSIACFPWQNYFLDLGKRQGVGNICYQHGEMGLYPDSLFSAAGEKLYLDYYLCFGEGVTPLYTNVKEVIPVGAISLEKNLNVLKSGQSSQKKTIVYATGKYFYNSGPFIESISPDMRLRDAQHKILSYLDGLGDQYQVIFKGSNTPHFNEVSFLPKNVIFDFKSRFLDLINVADVIILDSPATTSIESAVTSIPMFVLLNRVSWFEKSSSLIQKRASVSMDPEGLISQLDIYLRSGAYPAQLENREFVEAFGIHRNDGACVQRAFSFLSQKMS